MPQGEQHRRGNDSILWNSRFLLINTCLQAYKVENKGVGSSCDSTVGYANEFQVYVCRSAGQKHKVGLGKKVILTLTKKLAGKSNHDYSDRYFNSVDLHQELLKQKLVGCSTVKHMAKLKGLPKHVKQKTEERWCQFVNSQPW